MRRSADVQATLPTLLAERLITDIVLAICIPLVLLAAAESTGLHSGSSGQTYDPDRSIR